jgi:PAS domain S-box-containing protein
MKTQAKRLRAAQSLTTTLALAFFSLSVIALLISGGLQLFSNLQTQQTIITGNQQLIAQEAARTVSSFIQEKFGVLETAVGLTNLDEVSQAEQKEVLTSLLGRQPAFRQLVLFNTQGQILAQASRLSMGEYRQFLDRLRDITWDQNPPMSRTISQVYIDPVTSEPMAIITVPMVDIFGDFKGTLLADVNLKFMWDLVAQLQVGQTGRAYVVDRSGNLLAFSDMARVLRGENVAHLPAVSEFIHHPASTRPNQGNSYQGIMGTAVVGTYVPLEMPDWAVVTELPLAETYRDVIREAVWASGITLVIAALASLLGVYLARRLAVPLVNLTGVATQIAGGERELQAAVDGPREVASLAMAFNSMTAQLRQSLESLEQRVVEVKQAEESLRETNETLQALFDHSPLAIIMLDLDGHVLLWNKAAERMYGWTASEVLGKFLPNISTETLTEYRAIQQRVAQGESMTNLEVERRRKDGSTFWLDVSIAPLRDASGKIYAQMSIGANITERKQAEEALRASEARYALVVKGANDGIWDWDLTTDQVYFSPRYKEILGYADDDNFTYNAEEWRKRIHPDDYERVLTANQTCSDGVVDHFAVEYRMRHKDGSYRWILGRGASLKDENGRVCRMAGTHTDMTERKQAEEALRESRSLLQAVIESIPFDVWACDQDNRYVIQNTTSLAYWGNMIGKTTEEVEGISEAVRAWWREDHRRAFTGETLRGEAEWTVGAEKRHHYSIVGPVRDGEAIRGIVGVNIDITERKQAEEEVRRLNEELEQRVVERTQQLQEALTFQQEIMRASSTGIGAYNAAGQCVLANEAAAKVINASMEQILAQNYHHIESWKKSGLYATALAAVESGTEKQTDIHTISSFGREVWLNCHFVPFDSGGQPHLLLTVNDMTERMRAEGEIRELNQQLQVQADNLAAANKELEAFSYSVSHDLRAPLRAIDGYTRILVEDYEAGLGAEGRRVCGVIRAETQRMGQLIDDLLAFSRLNRTQMQAVSIDMAALVTSVFQELTTPADRERLDFRVDSLPPAVGDPAMIRQVWINLLANAVKFSAKRERTIIEVGNQQEGDEAIYYVRDNGAGFDMRYADKLFGVFQRLHSEREFAGTGVGLAIVQRVIHRHGGRVWADSSVNQGATFYFTLPRKGD